MKNILLLFFALTIAQVAYGQNNIVFNAGISYTDGVPTYDPGGKGSRFAVNFVTKKVYVQTGPGATWSLYGNTLQQTVGCVAPSYTPSGFQSDFVVNGCDSIYYYHGGAWHHLNAGGGASYTAGSGISINGSNVISNTGDLSTTNELNTGALVTGGNLRITDAGGNLDVPVTDIAPVQAVAAGTGISITGTSTRTIASTITQADGSETKINAGTGISKTGSGTVGSPYVITNSAPDQTVSLTGAGGNTVTGTYPSFTITGTPADGTETKVSAGTGISVSGTGSVGSPYVVTNTSINTDAQNLSLTGQALSISGGTGATLPVIGITAGTGVSVSPTSGNYTITNTGDTNASDDITTSTSAGGDLSGTFPNPTVSKLRTVPVSNTAPTTGQVLKFNGTDWEPGPDNTGGGSGGGSVASVTGASVDNTDPANPVINAVPFVFPDEMEATGGNAFQGGSIVGKIVNFSNSTLTAGGFPFFGIAGTDGVTTTSLGYYDDGGLFFSLEATDGDKSINTLFSPLGVQITSQRLNPSFDYTTLSVSVDAGVKLSSSDPIDITNNANIATVEVVGDIGRYKRIVATSADYTLPLSGYTFIFDATTGNKTASLPSSSSCYSTQNGGHVYTIKKVGTGSNTVTIDPDGSETIDGSSTYILSTVNQFITIQTDGSNWYVIGKG